MSNILYVCASCNFSSVSQGSASDHEGVKGHTILPQLNKRKLRDRDVRGIKFVSGGFSTKSIGSAIDYENSTGISTTPQLDR